MRLNEQKLKKLIAKTLNETISEGRRKRKSGSIQDTKKSSSSRVNISSSMENLKKPLPPGTYKVKDGGTKTFSGSVLNGEVEKVTFTDKDYSVVFKGGATKDNLNFIDEPDVLQFGINLGDLSSFEKISSEKKTSKADGSSKTGASKAKSGGKSSNKTRNIQKIVGAEPDGKWGSNTSTKWSEWISSEEGMKGIAALAKEKKIELKENKTLNRLDLRNLLEISAFFPHMNEAEQETEESNPDNADTESDSADTLAGKSPAMEIPGNVKTYVDANKGSAATIAKALGYTGNLSGVNQLANDIKSKTANTGESETTDKPPGESSTSKSFKVMSPKKPNEEITISLGNLYGTFKGKEKRPNDSVNLNRTGDTEKYYYYFSDANGNSLKDGKPLVLKTKSGSVPITKLQNANVKEAGTRFVNFNSKFTGNSKSGGMENNAESDSSQIRHITNELKDGETKFLGQMSKKENLIMITSLMHDENTPIVVVYYYITADVKKESRKYEADKLFVFETLLKYGIIG